jgi:hypothetical protein
MNHEPLYLNMVEHLCTLNLDEVEQFIHSKPEHKYFSNTISTYVLLQEVASEHELHGKAALAKDICRVARMYATDACSARTTLLTYATKLVDLRKRVDVILDTKEKNKAQDLTNACARVIQMLWWHHMLKKAHEDFRYYNKMTMIHA